MIPFDEIIIRIFKIDKNEGAFNSQLERMDYKYKTAFANMSSIFCIMIGFGICMTSYFILKKCFGKNPLIAKGLNWLYKNIYLKLAVMLVFESSLEVAISAFIDID